MESKLFDHALKLYHLLETAAEDGVFTGNQRTVFLQLGLSPAYNSILYGMLRDMGCIETVQRGAGNRPSVLNLVRPPQFTQFQAVRERENRLTPRVNLRTLENRLYALEQRLPEGVDLAAWIIGIERRLAAVEAASTEK